MNRRPSARPLSCEHGPRNSKLIRIAFAASLVSGLAFAAAGAGAAAAARRPAGTPRPGVLAFAATLASVWVVLSAATAAAQQNGVYEDVDSDAYFATPVRDLAVAGTFVGTECDDGFCPGEAMDRKTMAVWIVRVLDGRDPLAVSQTRFNDVDATGLHAPFIKRMAELGVTGGCGDGSRFCGDRSVTRAQMAVFLSRAYDLPDAPDPGFADVPADAWYAADVARLAASGITSGCGDGSGFCPGRDTTRGQMATFLHRAVNRDAADQAGPPLVEIESASPLVTSGPFEVILRFNKPVTGLSRSELTVVNGHAASLTGSEALYTARIEPAADGTVTVSLPAGVARAGDGTPNGPSAPFVRTIAPALRTQIPGIDTWNRPLVMLSSYAEFSRDEPDWAYTGNVNRCEAGTTSQAFRDSVIQRVNWYRQMAGLNPVTEDAALSDDAREAALIMLANGTLSHYPGQDWACYSSAGFEAAGSSNIGLGNAGVSGIDAYMQDSGDNNRRVGHRRWILYPHTLQMGTGNAREEVHHHWTANALDVIRGDREGSRPRVREERAFVSWPPSGYVHPATVWGRWSFSLADADFSTASVVMADASGAVAVEILDRDSRVGEPAIVWAVASDTNSVLLPAPRDGDHCYAVTVSDVRIDDEIQTPYEYPVCVIDPDAATGPSVTLASDAPEIVGGSFEVTVAFSEPVSDFTSDDIFVVNGTVESFRGSGADYEATVRADDNGTVLVAVGAGAAHNSRSLPSVTAIPLFRRADVGRPTVSVTSPAPSAVSGRFAVSIAFSEPMTGFSSAGIRVVNGTVSDLTGSGSSYRATITPAGDGTVMVRVRQDAAAAASGRANLASTPLTRTRLAGGGRGPGFDTWDRAAVLRAFTAEFDRDEPDWGYTGDVGNCIAGTTSQAFRDSFLQRLNWYRHMAGVAAVTENSAHSAAAQQAALIYLANGSFTVDADSKCYSEAGARAADEGPGWLGAAGIAVVDRYATHYRGSNHQKTVLSPHLAEVGIGHASDPASIYRVAHMMYTDYDDPWRRPRPAVREPRLFIAWPPPGYVPLETVSQRWSFSLPGADFSSATVTVADDFGPVGTTIPGTSGWYREEVILWSVAAGVPLDQGAGPTGTDPCYTVTISGVRISDSTQAPYEYAVCVLEAGS